MEVARARAAAAGVVAVATLAEAATLPSSLFDRYQPAPFIMILLLEKYCGFFSSTMNERVHETEAAA